MIGTKVKAPSMDCNLVSIVHIATERTTHLFVLGTLVSPLATDGHRLSPIIIRTLKFVAEELNDMGDTLKEDVLYPLVELCHPVVEVGVSFQV